jgi:hypothetical protein
MDIDKNYVGMKRFPTLSTWVYVSAMSTRLDEIVKGYNCSKGSPEAWLKKGDLLVSLPVSYGKTIIYKMSFSKFLVIMAAMVTSPYKWNILERDVKP